MKLYLNNTVLGFLGPSIKNGLYTTFYMENPYSIVLYIKQAVSVMIFLVTNIHGSVEMCSNYSWSPPYMTGFAKGSYTQNYKY